ncbi:S-layer homology domain-containing protein [Paenibacillus turpanensis]|uniref:S-layer homology domain-containing protein n=1 Tax=Paenibacillus turpanensis TaxID=2689078 RepID=UPI00140979C9|nr:S-layer homology domain-containing protein [Paenibacillus turpanensis]
MIKKKLAIVLLILGLVTGTLSVQPTISAASTASDYLWFDGVDDEIKITGVPVNLEPGGQNTVQFWMYWDGSSGRMPFCWSSTYCVEMVSGWLGLTTGNNEVFGIPFPASTYYNKWIHIAVVFPNGVINNTNTAIYIDGVRKAPLNYGLGSSSNSKSASSNFTISGLGTNSGYNNGYKFKGRIKDLSIHNRALTADEVASSMTSNYTEDAFPQNGLVGYWVPDHLSTAIVNDQTSNRNHGTVLNVTTSISNSLQINNNAGYRADLSWNPVSAPSITYSISRGGSVVYVGSNPSFTDWGLVGGRTYHYQIKYSTPNGETAFQSLGLLETNQPSIPNPITLDGIDDFVHMDNLPSGTWLTDSNTVEMWYYLEGSGPSSLFTWEGTPYGLQYTGQYMGITTGNGDLLGFDATEHQNSWMHIAVVFPNGVPTPSTAAIYVNGISKGLSLVAGSSSVSQTASLGAFISGSMDSKDRRAQGRLAEIALWNYARSLPQIRNDSLGLTGSEPGLAGLWKPTDQTTGRIYDLSSNKNDAVVHGYPAPIFNLQATAVSNTEISLSWNAVPGVSAYVLREKTTNTKLFEGLDTSFTVKDLTPVTSYRFELSAGSSKGESAVEALTVGTVPTAPNVSADDANNVIVGLTTAMEYKVDSGSFVRFDGTNAPDLSGTHVVAVRYAADPSSGAPAGAEALLSFTPNPPPPPAPNVSADDANNVIIGLTTAMEYKVDGGSFVRFDGTNAPDLSGTHAVAVRYAADSSSGAPAGAEALLSFTTNPPPLTYLVDVISDQTMTDLTAGYESGTQETKTITITNTGTGDLQRVEAALQDVHAQHFTITPPDSFLQSGASSTFTVRAVDGLPAGTYTGTVTISADHLPTVSFTVTQVVNVPNAPANPQQLVAEEGSGQATLTWDTVTGATYYNVYMSTLSGHYPFEPIATVTDTVYTIPGLVNGNTYYFVVKAGNSGGLSAESNQVEVTPAGVPGAPTLITASAGDGQATISFTAPSDHGGSPITGYEVSSSPGNVVVTGAESPITLTGLTNGTTYTFTVRAINKVGSGVSSAPSNAVTPSVKTDDDDEDTDHSSGSASGSTAPLKAQNDSSVNILVNGKIIDAARYEESMRNGQTVLTVILDPKKIEAFLRAEGQYAVVTIPVEWKTDILITELSGQLAKIMESYQAFLEVKTNQATYNQPAAAIGIDSISQRMGAAVPLEEIVVQIELAVPSVEAMKQAKIAATKGSFTLVGSPIDFTVRAVNEDNILDVSKFNQFVKRSIVIPDSVDPAQISTAVVLEADGTVRHVPTKVISNKGKHYAEINSLTNSIYSLIWNPVEFQDVEAHWAKHEINEMGSRMIIDGTSQGVFSPDDDITRAEFAAILVRALGLKPANGTGVFSDVQPSDWHYSAVHTAYNYKLISGFEDQTFRPNDKITREQAMVILAKAMEVTKLHEKGSKRSASNVLDPYLDRESISEWAEAGAANSVEAGIVSGKDDTQLAPKNNMTRAEAAVMIKRLLQQSDLI